MGEVREFLASARAEDVKRPLPRFNGEFIVLGAMQNVI
jgi:hypothetical protein